MAARRRSMDRSRGLASRLFAVASLGSCGILSGGCSVETTASCTCEPASGRKERLGSGPGFQPSRRRLLRTAFSLRPSRPAIQRLLISLALRRRWCGLAPGVSCLRENGLPAVPSGARARSIHRLSNALDSGEVCGLSSRSSVRYRSDPRIPTRKAEPWRRLRPSDLESSSGRRRCHGRRALVGFARSQRKRDRLRRWYRG